MSDIQQITRLLARCRPIFAGQNPSYAGAALADLLAIWLAGHFDSRGRAATRMLRENILQAHLSQIWELVEANEAEIRARRKAEGKTTP